MAKVDRYLSALIDQRGSDLHLSAGRPALLRVHGDLVAAPGAKLLSSEDVSRMTDEVAPGHAKKRAEGGTDLDFAYELSGKARFRVNAFHQQRGASAVFRVIPTQIASLSELGLPKVLERFASFPHGLVLVTGPTGSGKTTTLASIVDGINRERACHIVTIEDPIEFVHRSQRALVTQREVGAHAPSFAAAVRMVARQDPDIILVGEMRDLETISLTLTAAEMGALVFATVHTNSVPKTVDRLVDVFPESEQDMVRTLLAGSLRAILTQQLVKTADGKGRACAAEIAICTHGIANLIREGKIFQLASSMQAGRGEGMQTLEQALAELVEQRKITKETAYAAAINKEHLAALVGLPPEGPARGQRTPGAEGPAAAS